MVSTNNSAVSGEAALATERSSVASSRTPSGASSRTLLQERYKQTRERSTMLAQPLSAEDQTIQSMPDASPAKWHLAHTSWFFETFILASYVKDYQPFDDQYRYLFNSYYQSIGPQYKRANRGVISRPGAEQVSQYRAHVDQQMMQLLAETDMNIGGDVTNASNLQRLVEIGIHHEQQHQELLLTDIKHAFSLNPGFPAYQPLVASGDGDAAARQTSQQAPQKASEINWIAFDGGIYEIGHQGDGFCFDNELPRHKIYLDSFELASRLVTNGEYLAFINAGGYQDPAHWLSDGWDWRNAQGVEQPLYWYRRDDEYMEFRLSGLEPLALQAPVTHVSYYEASAYAQWAGLRLPREHEWEVASQRLEPPLQTVSALTLHPPEMTAPATMPASMPASGLQQPGLQQELQQMYNVAWQWTASAYDAYPGYQTPAGAVGEYNGKFMCNQMVLRGGSCATPPQHIRSSYRNFFAPTAQWQFSGIRLAKP